MKNLYFILFIVAITLLVTPSRAQVLTATGEMYDLGPNLRGMAYADFDGDMDIDIAVGYYPGESGTNLLINDGAAHFTPTESESIPAMHILGTADLNNDGFYDLIGREYGGYSIDFWYNNGDCTFYLGFEADFGWQLSGYNYWRAADFNGDNIMDVVYNNSSGGSGISILFGLGNGDFATPTFIVPAEAGTLLIIADLDNDSDIDIFFRDAGNYSILNNGDGTFGDPISSVGGGSQLININNDGYPDLLSMREYSCVPNPAYSLGIGDGTFSDWTWAWTSTPGWLNGVFPLAMDFNNDQYSDIVICAPDMGYIICGFNSGRLEFNVFENEQFAYGFGAGGMRGGDLDGDGDNDIAMRLRDTDSLTVILSNAAQHSKRIIIPNDLPTIQDGLDYAWNLDTILVQQGTYIENLDFKGKNIVMMPSDYAAEKMLGKQPAVAYENFSTILDGGAAGRVFTFENSEDDRSVIEGFIIQNGYAQSGAGIYCYDIASPTILNNIFRDNHTSGGAAAIFAHTGTVTIKNNLIINNSSEQSWGGGIYLLHSKGIIANNTIYGNSAVLGGGGLYVNTGTPSIYNNIIWNNTSTSGGNEIGWLDIFPTITYSDIKGGWSGTGNLDLDPMFVDPANGDFTLMPVSPCIDAGDPNSPLDPDGTVADMGAYYYHDPSDVDESGLQYTYDLLQNYPNPFNPSTTIRFSISEFGFTKLAIYDVLGNEIETLVNEELPTGEYEVEFNTSSINHQPSSGVYFYQLKTGKFIETKKMILLK